MPLFRHTHFIKRHQTARVALAVLVVALATVCGVAAADPGAAASLDQRLRDAEARAAAAREREESAAEAVREKSEQIDVVERQAIEAEAALRAAEAQLSSSRRELESLRVELRELTTRLRSLRRQLAIAHERLSERAVEIYTTEDMDAVGVILGAGSLDELLDQIELFDAVTEQDAALIGQVRDVRARTAAERAKTERMRKRQARVTRRLALTTADRRAAHAALVARRDALEALRADRARSLAEIEVDREQFEAEASALAEESARVAELATTPPPPPSLPTVGATAAPAPAATSSGFVWPVAGSVTSPFGARWGRSHEGVDIAAPAGSAVVASASGTVIHAGWMGGYGLLVLVRHAGGIVTAYAHNAALAVGVGQTVAQGQQVASVGCTGQCSGNHVHFEVRVNGAPTDPMGYL